MPKIPPKKINQQQTPLGVAIPKGKYDTLESRIICGDSLEVMPTLPMMDLVFCDPPFNIGVKYKVYDDNRPEEEYRQWMYQWLDIAWSRTAGVLALHGPDKLADIYILWANSRDLLKHRITWVNWWYHFGQNTKYNFVDARCHCMIFARKPKGYVWNYEDILIESFRSSAYGDHRIQDSSLGGKRVPGTVWGGEADGKYWGRIQGNNAERVDGQPNQLPEVYLKRLILAYTHKGDNVLDPFGGGGTTITVANALGRKGYTIEVDEEAVDRIKDRCRRGAIRV